ncbi:hypothetical protein [Azonexus hydrophilus]|uniref:Uncharacterized protein n=1 Tax=Azonexus hydrophilus TaxID=418702 RepID=A0ABZ2XL24_9RHOO
MNISRALDAVAAQYDPNMFLEGDCHTLAVALFETGGHKGKLVACLRKTIDERGSVYSTGYSHMVYECPEGMCWDIGGQEADVRWEDQFPDLDSPDKWGMTTSLEWVEVPYEGHQMWLMEHYGCIDNMLGNYVKQIIRESSMTHGCH